MDEVRDLSLVMTFKNQDDKDAVVTLKQVRDDIDQEEIESTMDLIISTDIFSSTGGSLVKKVKAQVVNKSTEEYKFN